MLLIVVGVDIPEGSIFDASRTERDTIRGKRRKVGVVERIQVDIAGIEIDETPAIQQTNLDEAQLAPGGRQIPLLNKTTADAARIVDVTLAGGAVAVFDREVPPCM